MTQYVEYYSTGLFVKIDEFVFKPVDAIDWTGNMYMHSPIEVILTLLMSKAFSLLLLLFIYRYKKGVV